MTIRLVGRLICATQAESDVVALHLPTHVALSRAEPGCLRFDVWQSDDPLIWLVAEEFRDRASFDAHQRRGRASDWQARTHGIARVYEVVDG